MKIRKMTAALTLTALTLGISAGPAFAKGPPLVHPGLAKISQKFQDMGDYTWGLNHVVKMQVKGIFKGQAASIFAPGAKITHQEASVATVRLIDKEAEAQALTSAEVDALLKDIPDQAKIALWARASTAILVQAGAVEPTAEFNPLGHATRLDVAILLVKAMGLDAEAQANMDSVLTFADAARIPASAVGYVAVAVEKKLITGYDDRTFRPEQAVKRVEMAVMMGRADGHVKKDRYDEIKGTLVSADVTANSVVIKVGNNELTVGLTDEAAIFVDNNETGLGDLTAGMRVEVKLNTDGLVIYLEAKTPDEAEEPADDVAPVITASGTISALVAATETAPGTVSLTTVSDSVSTTTQYTLDAAVIVTINGTTGQVADLQVGDTTSIAVTADKVTQITVTRPQETVIFGNLVALAAEVAGTEPAPAKISIAYVSNSTYTVTTYDMTPSTQILVNGAADQFTGLQLGDSMKVTLISDVLTKIEITRS